MIRVLDYATSKGDGICNEDRAGAKSDLAWIVDGATSLREGTSLPAQTDADWMAGFVDRYLTNYVADSAVNTAIIMRDTAIAVGDELKRLRYPSDEVPPVCSCGVVGRNGPEVTMGIVGDVFLYAGDRVEILLEDTLFRSREAAASFNTARDIDGSSILTGDDRLSMARRRMQYIRGDLGSFVLSANPDVSGGVRTISFEAPAPIQILMCTDGFARLLDCYKLYPDWSALMHEVTRRGLTRLIDELRAHEAKSGTETSFKRSDDACAILVEI